MTLRPGPASGCAALILLLLTGSAWGEPRTMRHSGTVVDIDEGTGTILVGEVGPWRRVNGRTVVTYLTIDVPRSTPVVLVDRVAQAPSGFPGDFSDFTLAPFGLIRGDFVTVDCLHEGERLVALRITVIDPEAL